MLAMFIWHIVDFTLLSAVTFFDIILPNRKLYNKAWSAWLWHVKPWEHEEC